MVDLPPKGDELGQIDPRALASMAGLEFFQKAMAGELPLPTICGTVPMRLHEVAFGKIVYETRPTDQLLNPMGGVHGGYAMTVLDSALGCAVHSTLPVGRAYATLELKTNLVKAIRADAASLFAEGRVVQSGGRVATAEGRLTDGEGVVYAFATTTCLVFDL
ncbi:MAG: PaaI family thioesterase [Pseudomonadota bacterium]